MKEWDVLVIGAGTAGLAAAVETAARGARTLVVDKAAGGLLGHDGRRRNLYEETVRAGAVIWTGCLAWRIVGKKVAICKNGDFMDIQAQSIVLATGCEEFVPAFPGSNLPGVYSLADIFANTEKCWERQRVLIVGTGNRILEFSCRAQQAGAHIAAIIESRPYIYGGLKYLAPLRRAGIPILTETVVVQAVGENTLDHVVLAGRQEKGIGTISKDLAVDVVVQAGEYLPVSELAWLAGCRFTHLACWDQWVPCYDENMQTSIPGFYAVGGVAGANSGQRAMVQGRLAGIAISQQAKMLDGLWAEEQKGTLRKWLRSSQPEGQVVSADDEYLKIRCTS